MGTYVYIVKNELPIEKEMKAFLCGVVPQDKKERILQNRCPDKGDMMLIGGAMTAFMFWKYFGIPLEKQEMVYGAHGKPYLSHFPDVHFSISHSGTFVGCAVSDAPVGMDIQGICPYIPKTAKRVCNAEELAVIEKSEDAASEFTRLWTRKEAVVKKYGTGILGADIKNCLSNENVTSWREGGYWISISETENGQK